MLEALVLELPESEKRVAEHKEERYFDPYCSVMQINNGKVIRGRDYYDVSTILRQLGLVS